jgi:chromosome segregation ATPase
VHAFGRTTVVVAMVLGSLLWISLCSDAGAQHRRGRSAASRHAAAAAAARKRQMTLAIQQQVAEARQVLATAETRAALSQAQVNQAVEKLSSIRTALEAARADDREAEKTLRAVEAEILAEQGPHSEFARAQTALEETQRALHRQLHGSVALPDDAQLPSEPARLADSLKLTEAQRQALQNDAGYQQAYQGLKEAARNLERVRQALLQQDADWIAARQDCRDAEQRARESEQQAGTAGLGSLGSKLTARNAQQVAAAARTIIAQGESQLRGLGVSTKTPSPSSSTTKPR